MSSKKEEILHGLRNLAAQHKEINRVIIFNVTSDLQPPPGRNPEVKVELIGTRLDDSVFLTLSTQLINELVSLWPADAEILKPGQKVRTDGCCDCIIAYEKV